MTLDTMYRFDKVFAKAKIPQYPYIAQAPMSVKPHLVKNCGEHFSVRLRIGWRLWGFETKEMRDKFVMQYGGREYVYVK